MRLRFPIHADLWLALLAALMLTLALLSAMGCSTSRVIEKDPKTGLSYEVVSHKFVGLTVFRSKDTARTDAEKDRAKVRAALVRWNRIGLIAMIAGIAGTVAIQNPIAQRVGVGAALGGAVAWCLTLALLYTLSTIGWWLMAVAGLGVAYLLYRLRDAGLDKWLKTWWGKRTR